MQVLEKVRSFRQSIGDWASAKVATVVAVAGAMATSAHAQATGGTGGSSAFSTAVQSVSADIGNYGAALVGVAAIGVVFMVAIKYVKKISGAA